jgi:hypothetical protein
MRIVHGLIVITFLGQLAGTPTRAAEPEHSIIFVTAKTDVKPLRESPDGKTTLKIERDEKGRPWTWLYDKAAGKTFGVRLKQPAPFSDRELPVGHWAFSPDGKCVATGAGPGHGEAFSVERTSIGAVRVFDAKTGGPAN